MERNEIIYATIEVDGQERLVTTILLAEGARITKVRCLCFGLDVDTIIEIGGSPEELAANIRAADARLDAYREAYHQNLLAGQPRAVRRALRKT